MRDDRDVTASERRERADRGGELSTLSAYSGWGREMRGVFLFRIVKPIFHCDAKPLASGPGVGLDPQRHNFGLGISTCWYLKTRKHPTPNLKFALPYAKPKRKSVEYRLRWVLNANSSRWPCTFHVFLC